MNKFLPFKAMKYFFVLIGLGVSQFAFAQSQAIPLGTATFDACDRKLSFQVLVHETKTSDDELGYYYVDISAPGITAFRLVSIHHNYDGGGTSNSSQTDGGDDQYYGFTGDGSGGTVSWPGNAVSGDL